MYQPIFHHSESPRKYLQFGFISALLLITGLLNGCSTKQPGALPPGASRPIPYPSGTHSHKRASYNRPYKVKGRTYYPMSSAAGYSESGVASWYGSESGNRTAMGTRFLPHHFTAAHKTLPLPSKVRVTNLHNGRSVIVLVNDRGPFKKGRLIDLSRGAAKKIGIKGLAKVRVDFLG